MLKAIPYPTEKRVGVPLLALILLAVLLLMWGHVYSVYADLPEPAGTEQVVKFMADQDAYVLSTEPAANFGSADLVIAPASEGYIYFDLSMLPSTSVIDKAMLRMKPRSLAGETTVALDHVDDAWQEATVTWETKPAASGDLVTATVTSLAWTEWDVTPFVQDWAAGTLTNHGFRLTTTDPGVTYYAHESSMTPELVITMTVTPPQPGQLILDNEISPAEAVGFGEVVTFTVTLKHEGGTAPAQAQIRDVLSDTLHLAGPVTVRAVTPTVNPLHARVLFERNPHYGVETIIQWQGMLAPDAMIEIAFPVHVHPYCAPEDESKTFVNVAEAVDHEGVTLTSAATMTATCPISNVTVTQEFIPDDTGINGPGQNDRKTVLMALLRSAQVRTTITNAASEPVTLGTLLTFEEFKLDTADSAPQARPAHTRTQCKTITLDAGDDYVIDSTVNLADLLGGSVVEIPADAADELRLLSSLRYVVLPPAEDFDCALLDLLDPAVVRAHTFEYLIRPWDTGDAPDSTNHDGVGMNAYPGVAAHFPTVFDAATDPGQPQGPAHARPHPFHLGAKVELEPDADLGPAPLNLIPTLGIANQDRFDDGLRPLSWPLTYCQPTTLTLDIFISQVALDWFTEHETDAYLNGWLDFRHNGDWADVVTCRAGVDAPQTTAPEHILIDQPIDVVALGAGLHTLTLTTGPIAWAEEIEQSAWLRLSLSEAESAKMTDSLYGDGRGGALPFLLGETQDWLLHPPGSAGDGPDMTVALRARWHPVDTQSSEDPPAKVIFAIDYTNLGTQPAEGVTLTMAIPAAFVGQDVGLLAMPPIDAGQVQTETSPFTFSLNQVEAGEGGVVLLWWQGEIGQIYTGTVDVSSVTDIDLTNNSATATVETTMPGLGLTCHLPSGPYRVQNGTTCRNSFELEGDAPPNAQVQIRHNGVFTDTVPADENGRWRRTFSDLPTGEHHFEAFLLQQKSGDPVAGPLAEARIVVDANLAVDPISLVFMAQNGHIFHPDTLGWRQGDWRVNLPTGTYSVTVNACGVLTPELQLQVGNQHFGLSDEDGDRRYAGSVSIGKGDVTAAAEEETLSLAVTANEVECNYAGALVIETPGTVRDAAGVLTDADVMLLAAPTGAGDTAFVLWDGAAYGQTNPQQSGADGSYSFSVPSGVYRLYVNKDGYQPYRSLDIVADGLVNLPVQLTPDRTQPPTTLVELSAAGFTPASLQVTPGSVVEFVNTDLEAHTVTATAWDSGLLLPGERYQVLFDTAGVVLYADGAFPTNVGAVTVQDVTESVHIFVPMIQR